MSPSGASCDALRVRIRDRRASPETHSHAATSACLEMGRLRGYPSLSDSGPQQAVWISWPLVRPWPHRVSAPQVSSVQASLGKRTGRSPTLPLRANGRALRSPGLGRRGRRSRGRRLRYESPKGHRQGRRSSPRYGRPPGSQGHHPGGSVVCVGFPVMRWPAVFLRKPKPNVDLCRCHERSFMRRHRGLPSPG